MRSPAPDNDVIQSVSNETENKESGEDSDDSSRGDFYEQEAVEAERISRIVADARNELAEKKYQRDMKKFQEDHGWF